MGRLLCYRSKMSECARFKVVPFLMKFAKNVGRLVGWSVLVVGIHRIRKDRVNGILREMEWEKGRRHTRRK